MPPKTQLKDPKIDDSTTSFFHKRDNVWCMDDRDCHGDNDDAGIFERLVNWGIDPSDHFRFEADEIAWTGWAAYVGYATPTSLTHGTSMYYIGHNAAAKAFRYITVTPAAEEKNILARVAVAFSADIGIMIDDGNDTGDGEGADNFLRWYVTAGAVAVAAPTYEYQYRTGGGAVTTVTAPHSLVNHTFYGLWMQTRNTEWTSWNPRVMLRGEADIDSALSTYISTAPLTQTWTPARVGIYYRNQGTDVADAGIVDWFYHDF